MPPEPTANRQPAAAGQPALTLSCVIITMGTRPAELERAIASTGPLRADGVQLVLIGNGADLPPVPDDVTTVRLPENLGVAGGRNAGVEASTGDIVMFLDDDGWFTDPGIARHVAARFAADPRLAVLAFRVVDPTGGTGVRWHVPRLRAGDPDRSSPVTTFVGAGFAARRSAYLEAGGLPGDFFFAHEETDLAWQLIERGYTLEYDADAQMCHPPVSNARHDIWYRYDGRNRVWLARRNLPWPHRGRLPARLDSSHGDQGALDAGRAEDLVRWLRRGLADRCRRAAADLAAHRLADDPGGPPPGYLSIGT